MRFPALSRYFYMQCITIGGSFILGVCLKDLITPKQPIIMRPPIIQAKKNIRKQTTTLRKKNDHSTRDIHRFYIEADNLFHTKEQNRIYLIFRYMIAQRLRIQTLHLKKNRPLTSLYIKMTILNHIKRLISGRSHSIY